MKKLIEKNIDCSEFGGISMYKIPTCQLIGSAYFQKLFNCVFVEWVTNSYDFIVLEVNINLHLAG